MAKGQKSRTQKISQGTGRGARRANISVPPASLMRHKPRVKAAEILIKRFLADEITEAEYKHDLRQISKRYMRPTVGLI